LSQAQGRKVVRARWVQIALVAAAIVGASVWFFRRPKLVTVVHPQHVSLTEEIASSARVGGVQETAVGAQFSGTIEHLYVKVGDRVKAGQPIATLKNDVTQRQRDQARTAVTTARARLNQVMKPPLRSELDEAKHQVAEAKHQVAQINADLSLARAQLDRNKQLYTEDVISRNDFETSTANVDNLRSRLSAAKATVKTREAKLETLQKTPPEDVEVARAQLAEAQQAFEVAEQQQKEAIVRAPFAGVVTSLNAEQGQSVGANGVVNLVSDDLEIRVDLDESNLADLEPGQTAILSSQAFPGQQFQGKLTDTGAAVDEKRGIVTVKITPENPPAWLRPGQTVNVNLITGEKIDRLLVPDTAVIRQGSRAVVMIVEQGHVVEKTVITRPASQKGIPLASGVSESDEVIVNPAGVKAGSRVRIRRTRS
jgi:HlyD family secretion protein